MQTPSLLMKVPKSHTIKQNIPMILTRLHSHWVTTMRQNRGGSLSAYYTWCLSIHMACFQLMVPTILLCVPQVIQLFTNWLRQWICILPLPTVHPLFGEAVPKPERFVRCWLNCQVPEINRTLSKAHLTYRILATGMIRMSPVLWSSRDGCSGISDWEARLVQLLSLSHRWQSRTVCRYRILICLVYPRLQVL